MHFFGKGLIMGDAKFGLESVPKSPSAAVGRRALRYEFLKDPTWSTFEPKRNPG